MEKISSGRLIETAFLFTFRKSGIVGFILSAMHAIGAYPNKGANKRGLRQSNSTRIDYIVLAEPRRAGWIDRYRELYSQSVIIRLQWILRVIQSSRKWCHDFALRTVSLLPVSYFSEIKPSIISRRNFSS